MISLCLEGFVFSGLFISQTHTYICSQRSLELQNYLETLIQFEFYPEEMLIFPAEALSETTLTVFLHTSVCSELLSIHPPRGKVDWEDQQSLLTVVIDACRHTALQKGFRAKANSSS